MEKITGLLDSDSAEGEETIEMLFSGKGFTLERIVSRGQASPEGFWYDQESDEWVLLAKGSAQLEFEHGERLDLAAGEAIIIPAHCRHRVANTSPDALWLALHRQ